MAHFTLTHDFRAPSIASFWRCYFDPEHNAELDERTGIARRAVVLEREEGGVLERAIKLTPARNLPAWLRRIARGDLSYVEKSRFHRQENRIEYKIVPSLLAERISLTAIYTVEMVEPGLVRRAYDGDIVARVPVVGRRIERAVIAEMESSFEKAAGVTQGWLDRQ